MKHVKFDDVELDMEKRHTHPSGDTLLIHGFFGPVLGPDGMPVGIREGRLEHPNDNAAETIEQIVRASSPSAEIYAFQLPDNDYRHSRSRPDTILYGPLRNEAHIFAHYPCSGTPIDIEVQTFHPEHPEVTRDPAAYARVPGVMFEASFVFNGHRAQSEQALREMWELVNAIQPDFSDPGAPGGSLLGDKAMSGAIALLRGKKVVAVSYDALQQEGLGDLPEKYLSPLIASMPGKPVRLR